MVLVENIEDTAQEDCACGTWLQHWENYSPDELPKKCVAKGCNNNVEVGAHVQKVLGNDNTAYIVPFCQSCNMTDEYFYVPDEALIVAKQGECHIE